MATASITPMSAPVCPSEARGDPLVEPGRGSVDGLKVGKLLASVGTKRRLHRQLRLEPTYHQESAMLTEAIVAAPPMLAAGWSLLYLLFGGGLGGAILIFFGLKLIGR
jgi:hypothetical protein